MTKKRLSDLLREEAQKIPDSETTVTDLAESEESDVDAKTPVRTSRNRKTVKELTIELEAAHEQANSFQQKVTALESQLVDRDNLIEKLQEQLQQKEQHLEEQKILVSKLYAELQQAENHKQQIEKLSAELEQASLETLPPEEPEMLNSSGLLLKNEAANALSLRLSGRFISAEQPSTRLSNEDIGWFD